MRHAFRRRSSLRLFRCDVRRSGGRSPHEIVGNGYEGVSLDALIARARIASGEPYRYHIVSLTHETRGGRTFDVTTETQGLKYRAGSCSKGLCSGFYDVVLGADAFAHARVTIDYPKRTVRISPATGAPETPPVNAISISFENFIRVTTVRLGETSVPLAIDTGDESSINLPYDFYAEHRAIFKPSPPAAGSATSDTSEQLVGTLGTCASQRTTSRK